MGLRPPYKTYATPQDLRHLIKFIEFLLIKKGVYLRPYLIILCDYTFTIIREIRPSAISSSRIVITSQPVSVTTS